MPASLWKTQGRVRYITVAPRLALFAVPSPTVAGGFVPGVAAAALAALPGAAAVVDGPMFSVCGPDSARHAGESEVARYRRLQCAKPDYRLVDRARGVDTPGIYPARGLTLSVMPTGAVSVADGNAVADGADVAVQMYPPLIRNGVVVASNVGPNASRTWRVGLGVTPTGQLVFALASLDMVGFATDMRSVCRDMGYLDGGGSGRVGLRDGSYVGSTENRRVPVWIAAVGGMADAPTPPPAAPTPSSDGAPPPVAPPGSVSGADMIGVPPLVPSAPQANPFSVPVVVGGVVLVGLGVILANEYFDWWT